MTGKSTRNLRVLRVSLMPSQGCTVERRAVHRRSGDAGREAIGVHGAGTADRAQDE